ncbi:uncharacterized protein LOC128198806 [Bicyclus anynana]|uniref:Uncharacterized protein LOC128198806 n=1 Tax=Bicyclus anynana TaxID=110368 RepID=A0ABM3LS17_BICAN|nr:uncharacterized protein LOC128198806 [Bicyclus anynana]
MSKKEVLPASYSADECHLKLLEAKKEMMFSRLQGIYDLTLLVSDDSSKLPSLLVQAANIDVLRKEFELNLDQYTMAQMKVNPNAVISYQSWNAFEEMFCFIKKSLEPYYHSKNDSTKPCLSKFPTMKSSLPAIELPDFSGDSSHWQLFYEQFKNLIHNNPTLSDSEKVCYLVGKLKGSAASVCAGLPVSGENYSIIWKNLIDKYDDPRSLAGTYVNQLLNFKSLNNNTASGLELFLNSFNSSVDALKQLKLDNLTDFFLLHLALLKLDSETVKLFEITYRKEKIPSYGQLVEFVKEQSKVLSRGCNSKPSDSHVSTKPHNKKSPIAKFTKSFVNTESIQNSKDSKCILCKNEKHNHLYKCPNFMKLTPQKRFQVVKNNSYCTNCLSTLHKTASCLSTHNCAHCNQRHSSLLCFSHANKFNYSDLVNINTAQNATHSHSISLPANKTANSHNNFNSYANIPADVATQKAKNESNNDSSANGHTSLCTISRDFHERNATTLLGTAKIKVIDNYGRTHFLRCLVDPGSQSDYITIASCKKLSLPVYSQNRFTEVQGIGGTSQKILGISNLKFTSRFDDTKVYDIRPLVVEGITSQLPDAKVNLSALESLIKNIPLADDSFSEPGCVDLLIGVKLYCDILLFNKITAENSSPSAIETSLGYVIMGDAPIASGLISTSAFCAFSREPLDNLLERFWKVEEAPHQKFLSPEEQECEKIYVTTTTRKTDGSFIVSLPFKEDPVRLGNSYIPAKRRFLNLEKKFNNSPDLRIKYNEVIQDYLDKGILSKISPQESIMPGFYLPHRPVIRDDKATTKLRIVLDASMKTDVNISLNDLLHTGCNLQAEIFNILINVRLFKIAFFADVKQMYLCIEVLPAHRKFQRILFRFSNNEPLEIYEFNRVTFGLRSSPFLALRTLRELAKREKDRWPAAAAIIERDVYMDDLASSASDPSEAVEKAEQLIQMFKSGGFDLIKWTSNSPELLRNIPQTHRQSEGISFDDEHTFKILGLHWFPVHDSLSFFVSPPSLKWTKRSILSATAQLYDVLGLVGPVILYAKLIIKELWILKLSWDETLPSHIIEAWLQFIDELPLLSKLKIPRHLGVENNSNLSLLAFADASEKAYGCVIYTHVTNGDNKPIISLVCSKSRVSSPSSLVTLARLELNALVLLAKLVRNVYDTLISRQPVDNIFVFSDSTVALCWLKSSPHRFQTYIANRISQFQELLCTDDLYHISGIENPADCISRGLLPSQLLTHELWFNGPTWASSPINQWPVQKFSPNASALPEQKSISLVMRSVDEHPLLTLSTKFSSWHKYLRSVVFLLKFLKKLPKGIHITAEDLNVAETKVIEVVQNTNFYEDIQKLKKGISCSRAIQKLNPFIRDNILHVGGRLTYSSLDYCHKHPILLPRKGHIIDLLIDYYHRENLHAGPQILLSITRQKYWILSARRAIKQRIHKCIKCYRLNPKQIFPFMANLPPCRIEQANAYTYTGVDFTGPLYITLCRGRGIHKQKAYLCIFICLVTKAVHFELAPDLSSASFLNLFKRFISRSGANCKFIYSDNGTNFVSSKGYFDELFSLLKSDEYYKDFSTELAKRRIIWKLNPPTGSHFGGIWESNIKSAKSLLFKVIGKQILTYEEMLTVVTQIEAILNSRPLYLASTDPSEPSALTPAHFLYRVPLEYLPAPDLSGEKERLLSRFMLLDSLIQSFWKRFRVEYLHTLQTREKWNTTSLSVKAGTVVLINVDNAPPLQWPLGIITRIFPGKDGITRVAEVKTKTGLFIRPMVKLCPLPAQ